MQERLKEIAARFKELRELSEIPLEELSRRLNVPEESLRAFEEGAGDISASSLNEAAQIFHVDLAVLLTGEAPRMNVFTVTRAGKGVFVDRRKEYKYQSLAANFAGKKIEPFHVTVPPQPEDAEIHTNSHPGQEMDYMLEGTLKVVIHGNTVILHPGDCIYYDSSNPHGMAAIGDAPAKFIAIIM
jgi:quercetin dioxygenase-like cupin family protein